MVLSVRRWIIRPPAQPLALVSGARTQFTGDTASLLVENGRQYLWPQVVSVLQAKTTPSPRDDAGQTLTTDWPPGTVWTKTSSIVVVIKSLLSRRDYQQAVTVKLLNLEQAGKPVADAASMQRYSSEMMNVISAGLDKSATDAANAAQNRASTTMDVQSAADDTGLPMLVVRGPFNVVWQRLPAALEKWA